MKVIKYIGLIILTVLVAACNSVTDPAAQFKGQSAAQIYYGGERALAVGKYSTAVKQFEGLDALYPFSDYAEQAQLDIIYAYYQSGDAASAAAAAERFTHLYPRSPNVDYAYYMKGVADFNQDRGWEQKYFPTPLAQLDPGTARKSFNDFSTVVTLFPDSVYAPDARQHMVYLRNLFAEYELKVANYYFTRRAYVASINRANYILQNYQGTQAVEGAMVVLVDSYRALGMVDKAQQAERVLKYNYPNSTVVA